MNKERINIVGVKWGKKILFAIGYSLMGLVSIPIISLLLVPQSYTELGPTLFGILIAYFLPGTVVGLMIVTEILYWVPRFSRVVQFLESKYMRLTFVIMLGINWIIMSTVHWTNDLVFTSQFLTAFVIPLHLYLKSTKKYRTN